MTVADGDKQSAVLGRNRPRQIHAPCVQLCHPLQFGQNCRFIVIAWPVNAQYSGITGAILYTVNGVFAVFKQLGR